MRISDWSSDVCSSDLDRNGTTGVRWVIDPLDGTASYVRGYPGYAVSIGIEVADHPSVGVVVDALGRLTVAVTGRSAERDGRRARPSGRTSIHDSVDRKRGGLGKSVSVWLDLGG